MSKSDNNKSIYTGDKNVHEHEHEHEHEHLHESLSTPIMDKQSNSLVFLETTSSIDSVRPEGVLNLSEYEQKFNLSTLNMAIESFWDRPEFIELLLTKNPDLNFSDTNGSTPLHKAIEISEHIAKRLISMGANLNLVDKFGFAPIHMASFCGSVDIVELLLINGVSHDVRVKDERGHNPLHIASKRGAVRIVELLLSKGADIHEKTLDFNTPIIIASEYLNEEVVSFLLANGANVHDRNHQANSPILLAAKNGYDEIIYLLLSHGANIHDRNLENLNPIMLAAKNGHYEVVELLLKAGQNINTRTDTGDSLIILAAKSGHDDVVEILVKNGANIHDKDSYGKTPMTIAIENGFHRIISVLLASGGLVIYERDLSSDNSLILLGARSGHWKVVNVLMKRGANIHHKASDGSTPMSIAIENGFHKIVNVLLSVDIFGGAGGANFERDSGSNISLIELAMNSGYVEVVKVLYKNKAITRDELDGDNILTKSIQQGHIDIFKFLIEAFPRFINSRSGDDLRTPLMRACFRPENEYFDMLLAKNPKIDLVDSAGMNVIMYACRYGYPYLVNKILKYDLDNNLNLINNQDSNGKTALMHAGQYGCNNNLVEILSFNPSIDVRSLDGKTALMYAVEHERESIVNILLSSGASIDIQDNQDKTVLFMALETGNFKIINDIICSEKSLEIQSKYYRLAFLKAFELRNRDVIGLLLDKVESGIIDINKQLEGEENFLVQLLKLDLDSSTVPKLIDRTRTDNINARDFDGKTCIMVAFTGGRNLTNYRKSIIKKLLERGADIKCTDTNGLDCLAHIVTQLDPDALQYFFELFPNSCDGTDVGLDLLLKVFSKSNMPGDNFEEFHDIHEDKYENYIDIFKLLLHNGAANKYFNAVRTDIETCRMLLETRPDCLRLVDTRDYNSLMIACDAANIHVVELLLSEKKVNINRRNREGINALMITIGCKAPNIQVIELLLSKEDVDINCRNREGYSPLMLALNEDKMDTVQLLKDKGADTTDTEDSCPTCILFHPANKMVVSVCGHKHCRPCYLTMRSKPLTNKCSCCRGPL